jgi:SAM-dependent methyltransferase
MRDVIEHVADRDAAFRNLHRLLDPGGFLYVSFPPRWSPFAGHHQNGVSALRRVPWLHLLPPAVLRALGRRFGEAPHVVDQASRNFRTGLGVSAFRALARRHGFSPLVWELFWIRPAFLARFGLRPRRFPDIPWIREAALGCEALLRNRAR